MWKTDLLGEHLLANAAGELKILDTKVAMPESKKIVALLFSALWCPPCEQFVKDLIVFYNKIKATNSNFEIILVSSDKDDKQFSKYFAKMPWLAIPFNARETKLKLTKKYSVDSVPTLILLDSNGGVITKKGREKIYRDPKGLLFPWYQCHLEDDLGHQFFKSATNILSDDTISPSKTITTVNINNLFAKNRYVMLYFCAKWCAPCKAFTDILTNYCKSLRERMGTKYDLQVIVCSMDVEEEESQDYFLDMLPSWLAIPFYDKWRVEALSERFNIENIPHVVVISSDEVVLSLSARRRIEMDPDASGFPDSILSPLVENLSLTTKSYGYDLNRKPALVLLMEAATDKQQMAVIKLIEPFAIKYAKNKASTPDGPEMLFFINTASSPIGEKVRTLTGMPQISCRDKQVEGITDGSVQRSEEKSGDEACDDDTCRISLLAKLNDSTLETEGVEVESKAEAEDDQPHSVSHMALIDDENAPINMHMMIMDVPNGGEYYRYPCSVESSTVPNAFSPMVADSPAGGLGRVSKLELKEVFGSPADESKSPSTGSLRERHGVTSGSLTGYPSSIRTPPSASASTITTEASLTENLRVQTPVFTLSNIDQITRQFISDYQSGKLIKSKLGNMMQHTDTV